MPDVSLRQFLRWNRFDPTAGIRHLLPGASGGSIRHLLTMTFRKIDSLQPYQQLKVNDQLVSNSGKVNLIMQGDGNLVLYRTHFGRALWASNTGQPVDHIVMQGDGNLVAYSPQGVPYWETGTNGHPGAWVVLQDDGNLVVYDSANRPLWVSNTVQDLLSPTFRYIDGNYTYDETSEWLKNMCRELPCCALLQWPGYATKVIKNVYINGQPVVIQLWKGHCQNFLWLDNFPGGIGAEVGIYRLIPGKILPQSLPNIPLPFANFFLGMIANLGDNELWWPFPELNAQIEFTLVNPVTNQTFFSAGPETSYWLAKWMSDDSYTRYQQDQGKEQTPSSAEDYLLYYKINGESYEPW